jgi:hypothetical protein
MAGAIPGAIILYPWNDYSGRISALKLVVFAALFGPAPEEVRGPIGDAVLDELIEGGLAVRRFRVPATA